MSAAHKLCTTKLNGNKTKCQVKFTVAQFVICYNHPIVYYKFEHSAKRSANRLVYSIYMYRLTSEMPKFVCQYNFSIALTKINLKKGPMAPYIVINTYMCLVSQGSTSQIFLFFFFFQVSMPGILHEALPLLLYPMNKIQYA